MALSTRNRIPVEITEVVKGEAAARVSLRAGENHMVALITRESADELLGAPAFPSSRLIH
jgi:molybdopterin-binding protein